MYKKHIKSLFAFFLLFVAHAVWATNEIHRMRSNSLREKLQIVLDLDEFPTFNAFALSSPTRVVVDIKGKAAPDYRNLLRFKNRGVTLVRTGMRSSDEIRIVLDLKYDFHWEVYALAAEKGYHNRVVIDVYDGKPRAAVAKLPTAGKSMAAKAGRVALESAKSLPAITLESAALVAKTSNSQSTQSGQAAQAKVKKISKPSVKSSTKSSTNSLKKVGKSKNTVVSTASKKAKLKITKSSAVTKKIKPTVATLKETTDKKLKQREIIVVIDPGHGGKDSGALGRRGTREKDVVLQIAKRLKRKIDAIDGMRGVLTRSNDRYISLRGRLYLARKYKADLFVSIHADAFKKTSAKGSSVFILSTRGASSEAARWLAKRENAVDLKYGVDIGDYDKDVSSMLMGIQQDATIESSHILASRTLKQLKGIGKVHKHRVERAGFAVLKSPDIPSMLVETAFISNPGEEKKLRSPSYQNKLATSIAKGIQQYFREHLPHHLLLVKAP
ncbi:MAG: N-acetylmuramoyl-L-alanine amidase [Gammaproteobacteria bacterium]|nr:MAG: N-acetylmuramoyl-L-alanine amidase [Gammaproteobacteria bacterium]